jgi:hypothetical protein
MMVFGSADDVVLIGGIKLTMEDEPRLLPRR